MNLRKAVVLCGGKETRLRPFSFSVPGHMLLNAGHPARNWTLGYLHSETGLQRPGSRGSCQDRVESASRRGIGHMKEHGPRSGGRQ
jgi:hypothetical protein